MISLLKRLNVYLTNPEEDATERLFLLLTGIALVAAFIVMISGFIMGEQLEENLVLGFTCIFGSVVVWLSIKHHRVPLGAMILSLGVCFFLMPTVYFFGGGIYGGATVWFSFFYLYIGLILKGTARVIMFISLTAIAILEYASGYFHLVTVIPHSTRLFYLDSLVSVIIVGMMIYVMVVFQNRIYIQENDLTRKQKKEIEELNRSQNSFFSSMSHEIRTPINTIIGLNEMILREDISDEVAENAKNIQASSKMLLQIINDILDMSKIESGKMEIYKAAYDTGEMLSDIVGMLWGQASSKGLALHIEVDPSLPVSLYGDEVRIKQILVNLLSNAIKYTKKGSVTLSISCRQEDGARAMVSYIVSDTGIGIRKESIPHLFSAFKRLDAEKTHQIEGTGLGLSIVKQFVDLMGGTITVNSVYTKGSTFIVELPQEIADNSGIGELNLETRHGLNLREHYMQSFEAPDAKLLIVDDNDSNLLVAQKLLRDTLVQIDTATGGKEALEKTLEKAYDLILMDHMMPEMDGIECLHEIRAQSGNLNKSVPICVLTANAGSDNQALYSREGFDGYLVKPVKGEELEREIMRLLPRELVKITQQDPDSAGEGLNPVRKYRKKRPVQITTDSVCDLPAKLTERLNIAVNPYKVHTEEGIFLDGLEAETNVVLSYMQDKTKKVRSEAPEVKDYEAFFAEQLLHASFVIHIAMAPKVSQGYDKAREAAMTFDNVAVINSSGISSGVGFLALSAGKMAEEGLDAQTIINRLEEMKWKIRGSFIMRDTEYLVRAGRLSPRISRLAASLMAHPVLEIRQDALVAGGFIFGGENRTLRKYIHSMMTAPGDIDTRFAMITYAGVSRARLEEIKAEVEQYIRFDEVVFQQASPAISSNCGPHTFGIFYRMKRKAK